MSIIKPLPIHELANIVPRMLKSEQEALNRDIATEGFDKSLGLLKIYKGAIIDGRNRQEALLSAGLDPRDFVEDIGDISYEEASKKAYRYNSRRNLSTTQKAIYAWNQTKLPKDRGRLTQAQASEQFGVSVAMLKHAGTISKYALLIKSSLYSTYIYKVEKVATSSYSRIIAPENILVNLFQGNFIKVGKDSNATNSIKMIAQQLKALHEEASIITETAIQAWDADAFITTESGKLWYREAIKASDIRETDVAIRMHLAELANFKFRVPEDVESKPPISEPEHSVL